MAFSAGGSSPSSSSGGGAAPTAIQRDEAGTGAELSTKPEVLQGASPLLTMRAWQNDLRSGHWSSLPASPSASHQSQPSAAPAHHGGFTTCVLSGWFAGALGELVFGHPFSTAQAHLSSDRASRLLRPSLRGLFSMPAAALQAGPRAASRELVQTAQLLYQRDGLQGLYRGASLTVLVGSLAGATSFATYQEVRPWLQEQRGFNRRASAAVAGSLTGAMVSVVLAPLEYCTALLQLKPPDLKELAARGMPLRDRFALQASMLLYGRPVLTLEEAISRGGYRTLWKGTGILAVREVCFYSLYYVAYEEVRLGLSTLGFHKFFGVLLGGAAAGAVGSICSQPFGHLVEARHADLERVQRMQQKAPTPLPSLVREWWHDGPTKWRRGLGIALLRSVPLNGFVFVIYVGIAHGWS